MKLFIHMTLLFISCAAHAEKPLVIPVYTPQPEYVESLEGAGIPVE